MGRLWHRSKRDQEQVCWAYGTGDQHDLGSHDLRPGGKLRVWRWPWNRG